MARLKAENYDEIKVDIINAAARIFAEKGFLNTNIIEIGTACKASKSRLYHYYPSKEAMLFEMLRDHVQGLVDRAEELFVSEADIEQRFSNYIALHIHYYLENLEKHTVLLNDAANLSDEQQSVLRQMEHRLVELMVKLLKEINPTLFKKTHQATAHAMLIYGMMNWTYTWYHREGPVSPAELAGHINNLCLNGIRPG